MDDTIYQGVITFINHEKQYATIDYKKEDKKKTITYKLGSGDEWPTKAKHLAKKRHHFRVGDEVNFEIKLMERGDRMTAHHVRFLYNTALELLVNKAAVENRFLGFLKLVDDQFFVKELNSYLFFPLQMGKWEKLPDEKMMNEAVDFKLMDIDNPKKMAAALFAHDFIPEYKSALHYYKNKIAVEATVYKVSAYAAYVYVVGNKVAAKINLPAVGGEVIKEGMVLQVLISYLSNTRIVVARV